MQEFTVLTVVDLFGGIRPMSRALGHKNPTTVQRWRREGSIPQWRNLEILLAARKKKIKLTKEQLQRVNTV